MSLDDLQKTIEKSIQEASAFTRSLFADNHWDARRVQEFSNQDGSMTIATVDREGRPHAAVVIAGCADGTFYFSASPHSALLGNLRRDSSVAFTISDKVVGRGTAQLAGRASELTHLAPQVGEPLRGLIESGWAGYIYTLEPTRVFAQST